MGGSSCNCIRYSVHRIYGATQGTVNYYCRANIYMKLTNNELFAVGFYEGNKKPK